MADTPPSIVDTLKADFELSDAQFEALPLLSEVDLVRQTDSHLIEHATLTTTTYHPFKLFIGESNNDAFHVYLYRATSSKRQYKMEITSVDLENGSHYDPIDATYYGTIRDLAYPFNTFLGGPRFVAVVKWYFTVGLRTGLFDEDPGFAPTSSWRRDLQGACNELIAATEMEEGTEQQAGAKRVEKEKRVGEKKDGENLEAVKQMAELRWADDTTGNDTTGAKRLAQYSLSRQKSESIMGYDGPRDAEDPGSGQISSAEHSPTSPVVKTRRDRREEDHSTAKTSRFVNHAIAATNEDSRRRAQGVRRAQDDVNAGKSRLQDAQRRTDTHGSPGRENPSEDDTNDVDAEAASLEAEYTELFRQREKINHRMRAIQNGMSGIAFQNLLEKIRAASLSFVAALRSFPAAEMLSGILIFNQKGENLIFRAFRNDCRPRLADVFRIQVISNAQVRSPILTLGSTTFSHVKHENIYLVAVTKSNANAALVFEFLYRLIGLGKAYFGKFDEEAVKNNFVLVYELLDEILDFGYPQNTETDTLKMYITTEGVKSERAMEDSSKITMQATGALSWRRADIKYRKNEAFVDVIEDVNLLMSATGTVLRADVNGQIIMRAYLSGTPECKFGLNDRLTLGEDNLQQPSGNKAGAKATRAAAGSVTLEDCQFHQCVKLGKFDADRIISFIPPDGEFELMRYRATENVNLPFKVHAIVNEVGKTKVEYSIAIRANYGSKLFATNVVVRIPTPLNTARITERTSQGKAKYEPEHNNIVWKIPRFTGQSEYVLSAEASLTSMTNQKAWSRPPLNLSFSLLMFTSSGLLVRYLKVFEKSNYSSVKWVRYMTRAGNYEIRF
ncbi:clathrin associated protein complex medium subunit [Ascochyta clinopodiicola]|nr:clathrin associated protein complex medium subunit [Ascochyta clinopodiicola]